MTDRLIELPRKSVWLRIVQFLEDNLRYITPVY